jgi:hypothetical protein
VLTSTRCPARRFGYSAGAFRVLCHALRRRELPEFFAATRPGRREQPKKGRAHDQIVALRKRNYSVYEISQALKEQGMALSATAVREVLAAEGFAPLPRALYARESPESIGLAISAPTSEAGEQPASLEFVAAARLRIVGRNRCACGDPVV